MPEAALAEQASPRVPSRWKRVREWSEYGTNGAQVPVDGMADAAGHAALVLGMVVPVRGVINADGKTGTATTIEYGKTAARPC